MTTPDHIQEKKAAAAFTRQSVVFDAIYSTDAISYKRQRVYQHLDNFLVPGSHILELNAGTGEDAIALAGKGHRVHATDVSEGMLLRLSDKVINKKLHGSITHELCSYNHLESLKNKGPYDHIFSNFAGLNCTNELSKVLDSFVYLLKPGGFATLVILPKFCLWEFLLLFRGKFKTAFRRFAGSKGAAAHVEGTHFRCWYYNPSFIIKHLRHSFDVKSVEGLCTIVPPSYLEGFAEKHPQLYRFLQKREARWKSKWPWKSIGDYYIITLQKRSKG